MTGSKTKFEDELNVNITFNSITKKVKVYVLKDTENLFRTDWMQHFNLSGCTYQHFVLKIRDPNFGDGECQIRDEGVFPLSLFSRSGKMQKNHSEIRTKEKQATNIKQRSGKTYLEKLVRLIKFGIESKVEFTQCTAPTVYV